MGRAPCCAKVGLHKGPWSTNEDKLLTDYILANGEGQWRSLPKKAGLLRCGKSCRLRWMNYLRPGIKRGNITKDEEDLIIQLQSMLGNRWSIIAGKLPGRTDNEIKNHWNTHLLRRLKKEGIEAPKKSHKSLSKKSNKEPSKKKKYKKKSKNDHVKECSSESTTSNSFGSLASGISTITSTSNQEQEEVVDKLVEEEAKTSQDSDISWSPFELDDLCYCPRIEIFTHEDRILFDHDDRECDFSLQEVAPMMGDNLLDKVYYEYLQLL
ncbi:hypothetical protein ACH5RR_038271 [Cinchona calisaya]|uniref:Uncharacterized protein n=1 Tax=Cinchona calisaya TaxID=153742 RepID=A0ABD2XW51_9GENT